MDRQGAVAGTGWPYADCFKLIINTFVLWTEKIHLQYCVNSSRFHGQEWLIKLVWCRAEPCAAEWVSCKVLKTCLAFERQQELQDYGCLLKRGN